MATHSGSIWFNTPSVTQVTELIASTMAGHLGIVCDDVGEAELRLSMPVDNRTMQPFGVLHGGASMALAETAGSVAATFCVDSDHYRAYGIEINGNHVRSARDGRVVATATPVHLGRSTQVWSIRIEDDQARLICVSRITIVVVPIQEV